jgi:hypothetical protein
MCTGAEAAMLAASVAATGASYMSAEKADEERKRALMQGIEAEDKIQEKANAATEDYVKETFGGDRQANYEAGAKQGEEALGQLLSKQAELGQGDVTAGTTGAVSSTYTRAKAQAAADQATKARNSARLLSRAGGAGTLFGNEAIAGADYASDMLGFGVDSRLNQGLTGARYGQAGGAGRNLALLGGLLSGAGRAYGGRSQPAPNAIGYGTEGMAGYNVPGG